MDAETSLGILVFLAIIKVALDWRRNKHMADNVAGLKVLTDVLNNEVVPILQDLASKAGNADVEQGMLDLAAKIKAAAEAADPGFVPPQPPAQS